MSRRRHLWRWWFPPIALAFAVGCRAPEQKVVVVREYVTVPAPSPQIPPRPALPSSQLPDAPSLADLIRALLADRERLAAWAVDLETRLKAYVAPESKESKEETWKSGTN